MTQQAFKWINNLPAGQPGLWQIEIRHGNISAIIPQPPHAAAQPDALDAAGGRRARRLSSRIFISTPRKPPANRRGISPARCLKALSAG